MKKNVAKTSQRVEVTPDVRRLAAWMYLVRMHGPAHWTALDLEAWAKDLDDSDWLADEWRHYQELAATESTELGAPRSDPKRVAARLAKLRGPRR